MTPKELRAALLSAAEAEVDRIVDWDGHTGKMSLTELEDQMLTSRQRLYIRLSEVLLAQQEAKRNAEIPVNESSGARMHPKGSKKNGCDTAGAGEL
jgi:anti-sigma-K factor RskA